MVHPTRRFMLKALGLGALSLPISLPLMLPGEAPALLECQDYPAQSMRQCEAGIASNVIQVSAAGTGDQHMNQWCWAACIEMIFRYYGYVVPQERIVSETWGNIVNQPADAATILKTLNRPWTDDAGKRFTATGDAYSANVVSAAHDLSSDMPLIIGTMGHAMVLTSLMYWCSGWNGYAWAQCGITSAVVRDPWPGKGRRILTAQEWMNTMFLARIRLQPA